MDHRSRIMAFGLTTSLALVSLGAGTALAQDDECATTSPDENLALVQSYIDAADANDGDALDAALADAFTDTQFRFGLESDDTTNADEVALVAALHQLYPTHENRVIGLHAFDDHVLLQGTLAVSEHTLTADGSSVTLDEAVEMPLMALYTVACGEIVSADTVADSGALFDALGVPAPPRS